MSHKGHRYQEQAYARALDECSQVARQEHQVAERALAHAEAVGQRLVDALRAVARQTPADGAAIADARSRLRELEEGLEATLATSIRRTGRLLRAQEGALQRFTVTLFGRTMAGKSTIREALTCGDGSTIGRGGQRTTRDVREYVWNSLRIIDTPGVGAFDGGIDGDLAHSVIDETDIVLFLVSSDSMQEEAFRALQALRQQNKQILFVLNMKKDLTRDVKRRQFLKDPRTVFDPEEMRGHIARIHHLASDELGMREVRVISIHAQAAFLSTRPEYVDEADRLAEQCRLGDLFVELKKEVLRRGAVRRVQTIVDGTQNSLLDLQEELGEQAKVVRRTARYLQQKSEELDRWLDSFTSETDARIDAGIAALFGRLKADVSSFIDENIEREDIADRWARKVETLGIQGWVRREQHAIRDDLNVRLASFSREMAQEASIVADLNAAAPAQFDPWDVKRTLRWTSAGGGALAGVAGLALMLGGANFWNPVGVIAGGVSIVAFGLSWLFTDREAKMQGRKAESAVQLRASVDRLESDVADEMRKWFSINVTGRLVRAVREDTKRLSAGMRQVAVALEEGAGELGGIVEQLNRRLLLRVGRLVGEPLDSSLLGRIARDPGVRTKLLLLEGADGLRFCSQAGRAIGEDIDGVAAGHVLDMISGALRPAVVPPGAVTASSVSAIVRLPSREVGRAIGRRGANVSLASRLLNLRIRVLSDA